MEEYCTNLWGSGIAFEFAKDMSDIPDKQHDLLSRKIC